MFEDEAHSNNGFPLLPVGEQVHTEGGSQGDEGNCATSIIVLDWSERPE